MSLYIPEEFELSERQKDILKLPINENYLITGGPGTGKTVLAVYRAKMAVEASDYKPVLLLVYNNPLKEYISSALKQKFYYNIDVNTYHQWIYDIYREYGFGNVPDAEGEFVWTKVSSAFSRIGKKYSHIIIDEAQDFPIPLLNIIKRASENQTYFIDPNQAIENGKTDVVDFIRGLFLSEKTEELSTSFRITKEVAELAKLFCENGKAPFSIRSGKKPVAVHCPPGDFDHLYKMISGYIRRYEGKNIGIITNPRMRNRAYDYFIEHLPKSFNVQKHSPKTLHKINFSIPGVKIVTFGTMKGLDFDVVMIPLFDKIESHNDKVVDYNRAYVAVTRTHGDLYMFYWGDHTSSNRIDTMSRLYANRSVVDWV